MPPSQAQMAMEAATRQAQVAKDKAEAGLAFKDPSAAFDKYIKGMKSKIRDAKKAGRKLEPALKALDTSFDYAKRKAIFTENLAKINSLNANSGTDLSYGINGFSHLTVDEFKAMYTGVPPGKARTQTRGLRQTTCNKQVAFPYGNVSPPSSVNWVTAGLVTPVRDQAQCGSCAAFSAIGVTEPAFIKKWAAYGYNAGNTNLSEQDLLECTPGDQCQGWWPEDYINDLICRGVTFESTVPYRAVESNNCAVTTRYRSGIVNFSVLYPGTEKTYEQALTQGPISIYLRAGVYEFQYYRTGVLPCLNPSPVYDHAIIMTGYTNGVLVNGATVNVFTAKNSW